MTVGLGERAGEGVDAKAVRRIRRSLAVVVVGLLIQLGATLSWTPGSFVIAAMVGAPFVVVGIALFIRAVLKVMMRKGAL